MAAEKIFIGCIVILVLFNFLFYIIPFDIPINNEFLSISKLIGYFTTIGAIIIVASMLPTTSGGGTLTWFVSVLIACSIFYSVTFTILSYPITIGIGLVTNILDMFPQGSSITTLQFLPWIFFTFIGLIGTIAGMFTMIGGSE